MIAYKEITDVAPAIAILKKWALHNRNITLLLHPNLSAIAAPCFIHRQENYLKKKCDVILALGGDGTFLSTARLMNGTNVPVLGVNLGRIGFLTDVSLDSFTSVLNQLAQGEYTLSQRMMLQVDVFEKKKKILTDFALNEIVFRGKMGQELIDLRVESNQKYLTNYWVDGLLISTPTGSTAYSLSAGGPIIYPVSESILLTPINPKPLSIRPIIMPANHKIKIISENKKTKFVKMVIDGRQELRIHPALSIRITKSKISTHILRPHGSSFLKSIRNKLGWSGFHGKKGSHVN